MLQTLKARLAQDRKHDEGFTLIELMVVVMIIAVLLAIAIPTFLGSQGKAKDKSAQSSLRNTVTAAKSIFVDGNDYTNATPGALTTAEPSLTFAALADDDSTGPKNVSLKTTASEFYAAAKSASGECFYIKDSTGGTLYARSKAANCDGTAAAGLAFTDAGWS
jgi:type IV pilus assembly protein PilA